MDYNRTSHQCSNKDSKRGCPIDNQVVISGYQPKFLGCP